MVLMISMLPCHKKSLDLEHGTVRAGLGIGGSTINLKRFPSQNVHAYALVKVHYLLIILNVSPFKS